jgi:hypothetical protein
LARFEFESGIICFIFLLSLFHLENRVCLSHGVQVAGAAWCAVMRTVVGVGDLVQMIGDGRTGRVLVEMVFVVCGREVGWRRVQSAPGMWRLGARVS